jgi:pimeloyl-ACP methyl ester carboxylesterase
MPTTISEKHVVSSRDGTGIAYWQSGKGPPLLLIHGATADHTTTWRFVLPELERHFTVYAMDRRGRGGSGDAPTYDLQREAEDVAAVIDEVFNASGERVHVLGHSYGAFCAIEAALLTHNIYRLILYEGVPLYGADEVPSGIVERLDALLEAGDLDEMLMTLFRDLVEMPNEELELMRSQRDAWEVRLRNVPTLPRELRALRRYTFRPERFKTLQTPVALLVGEDSPPREFQNAEGVAGTLPNARVIVLPGQQHASPYTAPELFVREVVYFLEDPC